jgi:hypothetical protein
MVLDLGTTGNDFANPDKLFYPRKHTCQTQFKVNTWESLVVPCGRVLGEANTASD